MKITFTVDVSEQRIKDLLTSAFEGGSNYWCQIIEYLPPKDKIKYQTPYIDLPLIPNCGVWVCSMDDSGEVHDKHFLDLKAIKRGLQIMAKEYENYFASFISENDDAITGDVFLQCCLFGKVIYD